LIRTVQEIDTRRYEEHDSETIRRELVPALQSRLEGTEQLFRRVFEHYESNSKNESDTGPSAELSFESTLDRLMSTGSAARRIADISFIARMELSRMQHKLSSFKDTSNHWEYVNICASIRRRVLKSADSLERAICHHEGLPSDNVWHESSVQMGLLTRRAYAIFARSLKSDIPPNADDLFARVRSAGSALAKLIGREGYEDFKIADRRLLRAIQQRVLEWLRDGQKAEETFRVRAGQRLWQDIVGSANLILQVSNRPELIEHDAAVIEELHALTARSPAQELQLEPVQGELLRSLYGLDVALDRYIEHGDTRSGSQLRSLLERLGEARKSNS
jgi:hypothetical protein